MIFCNEAWSLELKFISIFIRKVQELRYWRPNPRIHSRLVLIFFSAIVQNLLFVMNYLNKTLSQKKKKKIQGQKRPLQPSTIQPDLLCNADHSHPFIFSLVYPFRLWCALNSCPLQYLPCPNAHHNSYSNTLIYWLIRDEVFYLQVILPFGIFFTLLNSALHLYFPQ